ncbi:hypothetical protein ACFLTG_03460 [Chloroflexota bacterium]
MTGKIIEILVPTVETTKSEKGFAARVNDLDNKVIGILDNNFLTYFPFVERVKELLSEQYESSSIMRRTKSDRISKAPADLIDELASSCQVIINGVGS